MTFMRSTSSRFPRSARLRKSPEFDRVQRGGRRLNRRVFVVVYRKNELERVRIGLSVSRKVGGAVVRNRVKRWLREASRRHPMLRETPENRALGVDIVFIARPDAAASSYEALQVEITAAFEIIERDLRKESA